METIGTSQLRMNEILSKEIEWNLFEPVFEREVRVKRCSSAKRENFFSYSLLVRTRNRKYHPKVRRNSCSNCLYLFFLQTEYSTPRIVIPNSRKVSCSVVSGKALRV